MTSPLTSTAKSVWQLSLVLGLSTLTLGILAVVWPGETTLVVGIIFGVYLLISGVVQVMTGLLGESAHRVLSVISGALSIVVGALCFNFNDQYLISSNAVLLLGIWIGIGWLFRGVSTSSIAFSNKALPNRAWLIFVGIVTVIGGVVLIAFPFTVVSLTWVVGIWAIVLGVFEIVAAFQLRKAGHVPA